MIEDEIPALIENVDPVINGNDTDEEDEFNEELMEFCQDPCKDLFSNQVFKTAAEHIINRLRVLPDVCQGVLLIMYKIKFGVKVNVQMLDVY